MVNLTEKDYKMFSQIVSLNQESLRQTMNKFLKKHYKEVRSTKAFTVAIGNIPVAVVAHLDTVFPKTVEDIYYDREKNVIWSPQGLGADDRAGIFAIIKLIRAGFKPHIILTTDEEMGAVGAKELITYYEKPFADMKYIIQLDRRGTNDCVFYDCDNRDFVNYVETFGFCENYGSFSDISVICPAWGVAGVNLSVGYENEHSYIETFHISPFLSTVKKVIKMLQNIESANYYKYIESKYKYKYIGSTVKDFFSDSELKCGKCGNFFDEYELFPVKSLDGKTKMFCPDCVTQYANWCDVCQEIFEVKRITERVCPDCVAKVRV